MSYLIQCFCLIIFQFSEICHSNNFRKYFILKCLNEEEFQAVRNLNFSLPAAQIKVTTDLSESFMKEMWAPQPRKAKLPCDDFHYKKISFVDLPDEITARIASHMNYKDVCNLMLTTKRNKNIIKAYGKDKPKLKKIYFLYDHSYVTEMNQQKFVTRKLANSDTYYEKRLSLRLKRYSRTVVENVKNILNECFSVSKMRVITGLSLTTELVEAFYATEAKIGKLTIDCARVDLTNEELVKFCQTFKGTVLTKCTFKPNIWTDEVLVPLFKAQTSLWNDETEQLQPTFVTDKTLKTLFGGDFIPRRHFPRTILEIIRSLENICSTKCERVECHLGDLQSDQLDDAERYFNQDTGELADEYRIRSGRFDTFSYYEITLSDMHGYKHYEELDKNCEIRFNVFF